MRCLVWLLLCFSGYATAVPRLRLDTTALFYTVPVGVATLGNPSFDAHNIGDGSLSLSVSTQTGVSWVSAIVGQPHACVYTTPPPCTPIIFGFKTEVLAHGTYTAQITVSDPNAVDAPQVIVVTVQVGDPAADRIDQYIAPGSEVDSPLFTGHISTFFHTCADPCPSATSSTVDGGAWLSIRVTTQQMGTTGYDAGYTIVIAPPSTMVPGTYQGSVKVKYYDTRVMPVTMHLTTQPIAVPSPKQISLRLAAGGPVVTYPFTPSISLTNSGMGNLTVGDVTATGQGISAYNYQGLAIVTVDPGSLTPGIYNDGLVTIQCNGANCPVQIPVDLEVIAPSPPVIRYQGVLDNAKFRPHAALGEIMIVQGDQLSSNSEAVAESAPLPTKLGGTRVLINGSAAPLFYSSPGQVAFQMPGATPIGTALVQVERDGVTGNTVSVDVAPTAPGIVVVTDTSYHLRDLSHPTRPGETLILWVIGLGATIPPAPDGAPAPPLSLLVSAPQVSMGGLPITPIFAGLSPGSVGLYQVILTVPSTQRAGTSTIYLSTGSAGDFVQVSVQ
jgi:uncharacterized protein (TIGR03437 family)